MCIEGTLNIRYGAHISDLMTMMMMMIWYDDDDDNDDDVVVSIHSIFVKNEVIEIIDDKLNIPLSWCTSKTFTNSTNSFIIRVPPM